MTERERFEKWHKREYGGFTGGKELRYTDDDWERGLWAAWQAATAQPTQDWANGPLSNERCDAIAELARKDADPSQSLAEWGRALIRAALKGSPQSQTPPQQRQG